MNQAWPFCGNKTTMVDKDFYMESVIDTADITDDISRSHLFNAIPIGLFWKNKQGIYCGNNLIFDNIIKSLSISCLKGKSDEEIPWLDDIEALAQIDEQVIKKGMTIESENTLSLGAGKSITLQIKRAPYLNEKKDIIGIIGTVIDVTHQKQKEVIFEAEKVQKRAFQAYLENIIHHMPGYVYWKDRTGVMLGCNDRFAINAGFNKASDMIGKTDDQCSWKDQALIIRKNDLEVMESGAIRTYEDKGMLPDGSIGTFLTLKAPLKDNDGETIGVIGIAIDISERKKIENQLFGAKKQAEAANKAKSEFLACISHDLRTPLNGILGMAQILSSTAQKAEEDEYISDIIESGFQLKSLIEDILSLAELESGEIQFDHYKFDFRELVETTINSLKFQAKKNRIDLLIYYGDNVPRFLYGDTKRIKQVLMNLLGNAIKFTHRGHIILSVEPMDIQDDKVKLQVSIEDTGIGIPQDKIATIFEKFNRVNASYKDKYEGSGLGLTIVKQIVEKMGGEVGVNSQPGKGAIFWFTLELDRAAEDNHLSAWQKCYQDVNILIIDDNETRADILLKQTGVNNGKILPSRYAYETIVEHSERNHYYHIVIIHIKIESNLLRLVELIKNDKRFNNTSILLLEKPEDSDYYAKLKKSGVFQHITTPVQPSELSEVLMDALYDYQRNKDQGNLQQQQQRDINAMETPSLDVLLVEDNYINQKVQKTILDKSGHQVDIAETGTKALSMCNKKYDLIIMDLGLPDMSGIEVSRKIRQMSGHIANIPIIAITAHATDEDREKCYASGMNGYLSKPFHIDDIKSMIDGVVNQK